MYYYARVFGFQLANAIQAVPIENLCNLGINHNLTEKFYLYSLYRGHSQSALGAYYRRMAARIGKMQADEATARKLARIVYSLLKYGTEYSDAGQDYYERKYQE